MPALPVPALPKGAPSYVEHAEVFTTCCLLNQPFDLHGHVDSLRRAKVPTRQLVLDPNHYRKGLLILRFLRGQDAFLAEHDAHLPLPCRSMVKIGGRSGHRVQEAHARAVLGSVAASCHRHCRGRCPSHRFRCRPAHRRRHRGLRPRNPGHGPSAISSRPPSHLRHGRLHRPSRWLSDSSLRTPHPPRHPRRCRCRHSRLDAPAPVRRRLSPCSSGPWSGLPLGSPRSLRTLLPPPSLPRRGRNHNRPGQSSAVRAAPSRRLAPGFPSPGTIWPSARTQALPPQAPLLPALPVTALARGAWTGSSVQEVWTPRCSRRRCRRHAPVARARGHRFAALRFAHRDLRLRRWLGFSAPRFRQSRRLRLWSRRSPGLLRLGHTGQRQALGLPPRRDLPTPDGRLSPPPWLAQGPSEEQTAKTCPAEVMRRARAPRLFAPPSRAVHSRAVHSRAVLNGGLPLLLALLSLLCIVLRPEEPPADEGIVDEGFEHRNQTVSVVAQHVHDPLAGRTEVPLDARRFHRLHEHACQAKRNPLGISLAIHGHLEAVAEVHVKDLAVAPLEHEIRRVAVAESQDVPDHAHHSEGSAKVRPTLEPLLTVRALQPQDLVEVLAGGVLQRRVEHFALLQLRQLVVVRCHLRHEPVLHIDQDPARLSVLLDQCMERVAVLHPANHAGLVTQRHHRVPADGEVVLVRLSVAVEQRVDKPKELHASFILPQILVGLQQKHVLEPVVPNHHDLPWPLLAQHDLNVRSKFLDVHGRAVDRVGAGDGQAQVPGDEEELGTQMLQLQQRRRLVHDPIPVLAVAAPLLPGSRGGNRNAVVVHGVNVSLDARVGLLKLLAVEAHELVLHGRPLLRWHPNLPVERHQHVDHPDDVALGEVELRRLLELLVPLLVPYHGDLDELLPDEDRLLDQRQAVHA
eukprot:scaffold24_cov245-Pinguiococcus_pyrenoidosus.AAC.16